MLNHIIDKLLEHLASESTINQEDSDIYRFGIECIILKLVHYVSYILIGIMMNALIGLFITTCTLAPLRSRAGGYHAKTRIGCYFFSCSMVLLICIFNKKIIPEWFHILGLFLADLIICLVAPVENESNPLSLMEKQLFRKQTAILLCIANFIILVMFLQNMKMGSYLLIGIITEAVLLLLGKCRTWCDESKVYKQNLNELER